ncbi:MAG TPA: YciI family protein [Kiloniellales bacterium]|nr:YciI family protein [Kiloniellales bacterium]
MFLVLLRFSANRAAAGRFLDAHKAWIARGFDDGVFLLVGSLRPDLGGAILAHGTSLEELRRWVDDDPFVAEDVVSAEILEIAPSQTDARLAFLLGEAPASGAGAQTAPA